jgi:hypothetical protein
MRERRRIERGPEVSHRNNSKISHYGARIVEVVACEMLVYIAENRITLQKWRHTAAGAGTGNPE